MLHLISKLIGNEMADARRRLGGIVVILGAFVLVLVAIVFVFVALYLGFTEIMAAWQAALAVAGCVFVAGVVLLMIGRSMARRHIRYGKRMGAEVQALMEGVSDTEKGKDRSEPDWILGAVALAAVAGLVLGRRFTK